MTALLLNGSDWLLKIVTDRTLRDACSRCESVSIKPCTKTINLGVFRMGKTALWSFGSRWF